MFPRVLSRWLCLGWLLACAFACASLREAEAPAVALFCCTARALQPVAGTYERARDIAEDLKAKRVNVEEILLAAHATAEVSAKVYSDLRSCEAAFKAEIADAGAGGSDAGIE